MHELQRRHKEVILTYMKIMREKRESVMRGIWPTKLAGEERTVSALQ